jgi:hypothetical protein
MPFWNRTAKRPNKASFVGADINSNVSVRERAEQRPQFRAMINVSRFNSTVDETPLRWPSSSHHCACGTHALGQRERHRETLLPSLIFLRYQRSAWHPLAGLASECVSALCSRVCAARSVSFTQLRACPWRDTSAAMQSGSGLTVHPRGASGRLASRAPCPSR